MAITILISTAVTTQSAPPKIKPVDSPSQKEGRGRAVRPSTKILAAPACAPPAICNSDPSASVLRKVLGTKEVKVSWGGGGGVPSMQF